MPNIGDKLSFVPSAFSDIAHHGGRYPKQMPGRVTAVIDYINHEHRYYRASFEVHGIKMCECFKF